jgi:succinate dehydrogenase iron-sulfur subunit
MSIATPPQKESRPTGRGAAETVPATTVRVQVYRFKRGDGGGRFQEFEVPVEPGMSVLDALLWIKHHRDSTLALRHSCLHASCGTCGVIANGHEVLGCVTPVADLGDEIRVEPLANIPVLTDLVVDMDEFYGHFRPEHPLLRQSEFLPAARPPEEVGAYRRYEDCIECGLCVSACPVAALSRGYIGPAALAAAQRVLEEPRGADTRALRRAADGPNGAWRCHAAFECNEVCPSGVEPAERIMKLRRTLLRTPPREASR